MFFWKKKKNKKEEEIEQQDTPEEAVEEEAETEDARKSEEEEEEQESPDIPEKEETPEAVPQEDEEKTEAEGEKTGLFSRLKNRLSKTKNNIITKVRQAIRLKGKVDEELLEEIEEILIQADVGVDTTMKIVDRLREEVRSRGITEAEDLTPVFKEILHEIIRKHERYLEIGEARPWVILVVGVNGTGKTTTIGKLARHFREQGLSVMLVAGDTFRAAAVEQLEIWSKRTDSQFSKQATGTDPASVCYDALNAAKARNTDVVLIDTAGRLHTKVNLMEELKKMVRVIRKIMPDAPHESLIVLDATTGQNAINQMKIFSDAVPLTGVIMTKLDGTAKGGILIAIRDLFDIPVLKIGIGEKAEDLRDFNPEEFVDALFAE